MRHNLASVIIAAVLFAVPVSCMAAAANFQGKKEKPQNVQVGPRPYLSCGGYGSEPAQTDRCSSAAKSRSRKPTSRSATEVLGYSSREHTKESYTAAARMGAGIVECDVTFTKDKQLVCRHAQNDLHTTTNILETSLAQKCTKGFTPAEFNPDGSLKTPASAECRTSDITLAEFKTLKGKMDAFNPRATTVAEFMGGTPNFRTDLYSYNGTLLSHAESIELFKELGVKMTPELKAPSVPMPFEGTYTQEQYAQQMIDEYKAAGVSP